MKHHLEQCKQVLECVLTAIFFSNAQMKVFLPHYLFLSDYLFQFYRPEHMSGYIQNGQCI